MPNPTRVQRAVLLGAILLLVACADEPPPQHPTKTHKHKKKHVAPDDVVVTDDAKDDHSDEPDRHHDRKVAAADRSDGDDTKKDDDEDTKKRHPGTTKKKKHHDDDDEDTKSSDREAKKKKTDDDEDTKRSDREAKKKKSDDDDTKKTDDQETTKTDRDEPKQGDDADAKKDDDGVDTKKAAPKHVTKRAPKKPAKRTSRRKHADAPKTATSQPKGDAGADEIEMDEAPPAGGSPQAAAGGTEEDEASAAVAAPMPAPAPTTSPLALNDRALVARHGALEVHGGLRTAVLTLPGAMPGTTTSSTSEGFALGATYGIGDKAEIGGDYVLSLSPGSIKGPLTLHGAYLAYARPKLDVAVAGALAVDFQESTDPTTGMTSTKTSYGLQLGGWVRYRVAPKVALFTGLPALPASTASLSKLSFALPPLPYQLAVGLSGGSAIALDVPVGVGVQAAPTVYAFAMIDLAHLKIHNTANAFLFADFIPVTVGGFYSRDKLDLGATFADDLKQGTGYLRFELLARYALP